MTQDEAKRLVAGRAVEFVRDGMVVGLGTGTTSVMFIRALGERVREGLKIRCVASSDASHVLAESLGMRVETLAELPELDLYIDGADEVSVGAGGLDLGGINLIKGGGGALLREKIVASAAREFIVVADSSKVVPVLGRFPLPVEVVKMALPLVQPKLAALGFVPKLRTAKSMSQGLKPQTISGADGARAEALAYSETNGDGPYLTDEGNYILDCWGDGIAEPETMAAEIRSIVGVVEHGLFLGMATLGLVGGEDGVRELRG
jgi:ribose 5-phosphate isomerase A